MSKRRNVTAAPRVAIYVRISKDKMGANLGVERQEDECRQVAASLDPSSITVYSDNDTSAYSGVQRDDYLLMLGAIHDGEIDAVVVWHTDRLHRSPAELEQYISECEPREVPTYCVRAGELDLTTASGRLTARITGAVARHESEHMGERVREQKAHAARTCQWKGGHRPFGYEGPLRDQHGSVVNRERIGKHLVEHEAVMIRDGTRRVIEGESLYTIAQDWTRLGVPTPHASATEWNRRVVKGILTRARNAGLNEFKGEIIGPGDWPAIVSEDEWSAVCSVLNHPERGSPRRGNTLKWLGTNLYICGICGSTMGSGGATSVGSNGVKHTKYTCKAEGNCTVRTEPIDTIVEAYVADRLDTYGADLIQASDDTVVSDLRSGANAAQAKLDELADMLGDGELSRAQFTKQREKVLAKLDGITTQLAQLTRGSVLSGVADASSPSESYWQQSIERKQAIVDALVTVTILKGKPGSRPKALEGNYWDRLRIEDKV